MAASRKPTTRAGKETDLTVRLLGLCESGETGVLFVRPPGGKEARIFLMGGDIVSCTTDRDAALFSELLVARGADAGEIAEVAERLGPEEDLADALVASGVVDGGMVMEVRSSLFSENLAWGLLSKSAAADFEAMEAVFPPNMQFGVDRTDAIRSVTTWRERSYAVLDLLARDDVFVAGSTRPPGCTSGTWEALAEPRTMQALLDLLGPPRRDGAERLALWLQVGALVPPPPPPQEAPPAAPEEEKTPPADDYSRAAMGGFIKSYGVFDKVDLSAGHGAPGDHLPERHAPPSLEAIEAIDFDDDLDALLADEGLAAVLSGEVAKDEDAGEEPAELQPDTRQSLRPAPELAGSEADSGDFEVFDAIAEDGDVDIDDSVSGPVDFPGDGEDAGASASIDLDELDTPFTREQLAEFHERIGVFNSIFRILHETFCQHITKEKTRLRFAALLASGQRQYPVLLKDLEVEPDGSLSPSALVNNLACCPPGDYASKLHQGLYELIFSHLYDAKDMLPSDAEERMMGQIIVFERKLHQT